MKNIEEYLNRIIVKPVDEDWCRWELMETIHINVKGFEIEIPKGFRTDFASVPRLFWSILPPFGRYGLASIVHDYLYSREDIPKEFADKIFYILMLESKVPELTAKIMYLAVKYFGKRKKNNKSKSNKRRIRWKEKLNYQLVKRYLKNKQVKVIQLKILFRRLVKKQKYQKI